MAPTKQMTVKPSPIQMGRKATVQVIVLPLTFVPIIGNIIATEDKKIVKPEMRKMPERGVVCLVDLARPRSDMVSCCFEAPVLKDPEEDIFRGYEIDLINRWSVLRID